MSIIPAIREAEIRRITVLWLPGQKVSQTLSQPTSWVWWYTSVIPGTQETIVFKAGLGRNKRRYLKNK
jgi:hypothetical protein